MHPIRKLNRLQGYDYSRNALYFVTSCVQDMMSYFGEIKDNEMLLNEYGKIAHQQWQWLEQQYPYVVLHSFVVMPNHMHGIIEIDDTTVPVTKIKSLSELMGAYKTTTSKQIHLAAGTDSTDNCTDRSRPVPAATFKWQRSFHDHIIRNEESYLRISYYIKNNPLNWKEDKFYN